MTAADLEPIRTLVVDDERIARDGLRTMLSGMADVQVVGDASSAPEAMHAIAALRPQLLLLDVQLFDRSGIDMLRGIAEELWPVTIIVSAHEEHALAAYDVRAVDYVLKPISRRRLTQAVERAIRLVRGEARNATPTPPVQPPSRFAVRRGEEIRFLDAEDIEWIEVRGNYLAFQSRGDVYEQRATLGALARELGDGDFVRISRSLLINFTAVTGVRRDASNRYEFTMRAGQRLASSRRYRQTIRRALAARVVIGPRTGTSGAHGLTVARERGIVDS